jgi:hypothetical protein
MSEDRARDVGLALATIRTAIGVVTLLAPSLARLWVGAPGRTAGGKTLSRALAVREIVLGAGTLMATSDRGRLRMWLAAGAFADGVDALGTASTSGLPKWPRVLVTLSSGAAAVAGGAAAVSLSDEGFAPPQTASSG